MTDIRAVKPPRGRVVHLHLPGYQPGEKPRPHSDKSAMCGAPLMSRILDTETHAQVPLAEAVRWTTLAPSDTDPRPEWTWCRPCLGHAVTVHGLARDVIKLIAEAS